MSSGSASRIALRWPVDPDYRAVGRLVLGGVGARTDLAYERVEELGLALDTLARAPIDGPQLELDIEVGSTSMTATVGPFADDPLDDPAIRRIVETLADDARSELVDGGRRRVRLVLAEPDPEG